MNDNDLCELCKEVYEKTGWWSHDLAHLYIQQDGTYKIVHSNGKPYENEWGLSNLSLYTSDYLLEKLPKKLGERHLELNVNGEDWEAFYYEGSYGTTFPKVSLEANTPLKALLKLVIALDDAGVKL